MWKGIRRKGKGVCCQCFGIVRDRIVSGVRREGILLRLVIQLPVLHRMALVVIIRPIRIIPLTTLRISRDVLLVVVEAVRHEWGVGGLPALLIHHRIPVRQDPLVIISTIPLIINPTMAPRAPLYPPQQPAPRLQ